MKTFSKDNYTIWLKFFRFQEISETELDTKLAVFVIKLPL